MKRFSVIYMLKEQYFQVYCATQEEAKSILQQLSRQKRTYPNWYLRRQTELFLWEPRRQDNYNHADIEEQGKLGNQIISIAQALRYRDMEWQRSGAPGRLSFFA